MSLLLDIIERENCITKYIVKYFDYNSYVDCLYLNKFLYKNILENTNIPYFILITCYSEIHDSEAYSNNFNKEKVYHATVKYLKKYYDSVENNLQNTNYDDYLDNLFLDFCMYGHKKCFDYFIKNYGINKYLYTILCNSENIEYLEYLYKIDNNKKNILNHELVEIACDKNNTILLSYLFSKKNIISIDYFLTLFSRDDNKEIILFIINKLNINNLSLIISSFKLCIKHNRHKLIIDLYKVKSHLLSNFTLTELIKLYYGTLFKNNIAYKKLLELYIFISLKSNIIKNIKLICSLFEDRIKFTSNQIEYINNHKRIEIYELMINHNKFYHKINNDIFKNKRQRIS
jgi:hypothetical protein